ncbi:hypothetical protein D3C80_436930 [compost metagenome]
MRELIKNLRMRSRSNMLRLSLKVLMSSSNLQECISIPSCSQEPGQLSMLRHRSLIQAISFSIHRLERACSKTFGEASQKKGKRPKLRNGREVSAPTKQFQHALPTLFLWRNDCNCKDRQLYWPECLAVVRAITDFAAPVEEDGAFQFVCGFARVEISLTTSA